MSFFRAALRGANVSGKIEEAFGALKDILGYSRDGSQIAERLSDIPSAREVAGFPVVPPAGLTTGVKSVQPNVLSQHQSEGFMSDELIPPEQIAIGDLKDKTLMSIVGDTTGRHLVTGVSGEKFETPVKSLAGFQFTDVPGQGYAGDIGPTRSKLNEALVTENPYYASVLMGEQSGDFALHTGEIFGEMFKNAPIAAKNISKINKAIRNIGKPVKVKATDAKGAVIKNADGSFKMVGKTVYPYQNFTSVADPNAILEYIKNLPTGTDRAYFLKGLDKGGLQKMGVPRVADARLAAADLDQIGMDWGTTGYRGFVPDVEKGLFPTTPEQSTTYGTGIDKVGPSQSFTEEGRGIPGNLLFRDLAASRRDAGTGGRLVMSAPDYKVLEMSPKKAKQVVDDQLIEIISTFTELEKRGGRRAALQYAQELLSGGKITGQMISAARKANAPSWMIAAMAPALGALNNINEDGDGI
tara:strand:- start:361 stop:1767 length:1407 start_codon:yes stop_codon:yes gene_type:complete